METKPADIAQTITDLATPLAASLGLAIWGVDVVPAGRLVIRVFAESLDEPTRGQSILDGHQEASLQGKTEQGKPKQAEPEQADLELTESGQDTPAQAESASAESAESAESGQTDSPLDSEAEFDESVATQGGITIDQCAELSRLLGLTLEVEDCVESAYVLEVSSPGLERLFFNAEQLKRALGVKVEATLFKPLTEFPGRRKFIGIVNGVEGDLCTLTVAEPESVQVSFPWNMVKKIKQIYVAPEKTLPGKSVKNTRQKKSAGKKSK